jgi:hypothetical protein
VVNDDKKTVALLALGVLSIYGIGYGAGYNAASTGGLLDAFSGLFISSAGGRVAYDVCGVVRGTGAYLPVVKANENQSKTKSTLLRYSARTDARNPCFVCYVSIGSGLYGADYRYEW